MLKTDQFLRCAAKLAALSMALGNETKMIKNFKSMSEETGIPYQSLINLYLRDCAVNHRTLHMKWHPERTEQQV